MYNLSDFSDFTEESYALLIALAKENYRFIAYPEYKSSGKNILWRHDIDYSVHRAYKLAKIEHELKVSSTFFIHLHSDFYNVLEKEITVLLDKIFSLHHHVGLHVDPAYYELKIDSAGQLDELIYREKKLLESLFQVEIPVCSFHNPTIGNWIEYESETLAGMINTYSAYFKENYTYCSDSNGYWRHRRLKDVLLGAESEKVQVLTHPEWWTPEPLSPRERITRCIDGRAHKQHKEYDAFLEAHGRLNIK